MSPSVHKIIYTKERKSYQHPTRKTQHHDAAPSFPFWLGMRSSFSSIRGGCAVSGIRGIVRRFRRVDGWRANTCPYSGGSVSSSSSSSSSTGMGSGPASRSRRGNPGVGTIAGDVGPDPEPEPDAVADAADGVCDGGWVEVATEVIEGIIR